MLDKPSLLPTPYSILVTGPESSGKTTLARQLTWALDGLYVAEAARDYLEARGGAYTETDLPLIWQAQREAEDAARASSASFVVCDTGPEVIRIWSEVKYERCNAAVLRASEERRYDLVLLCAPDLPWMPDPLREAPNLAMREQLFVQYQKALSRHSPTLVAGVNRLNIALEAVFSMVRNL